MENYTTESDSLVTKSFYSLKLFPSSMGHVESRVNLRGPPRKAKYSWMSDSEIVPRGKGEKNPGRGVKENVKLQAYKQKENDLAFDFVPVEECSGDL